MSTNTAHKKVQLLEVKDNDSTSTTEKEEVNL